MSQEHFGVSRTKTHAQLSFQALSCALPPTPTGMVPFRLPVGNSPLYMQFLEMCLSIIWEQATTPRQNHAS